MNLSDFQVNESTSFGPDVSNIADEEAPSLVFSSFCKQDKVGKACDWYSTKNNSRYATKYSGETNEAFSFVHDAEEDFDVVNYRQQPKANRFTRRWNNRVYWHHRRANYNQHAHIAAQVKTSDRRWKKHFDPVHRKKKWRYYQPYNAPTKRNRNASVEVDPSWPTAAEIEFEDLKEARLLGKGDQGKTILEAGTVLPYNREFGRVNTRSVKVLQKAPCTFPRISTSDDPIIQKLIQQADAQSDDSVNVFGTEVIMSVLMASTRSIVPWDFVVEKRGNTIVFDQRPTSTADYLTVDETLKEPPLEDDASDMKSQQSLSAEATFLNQDFSEQVLMKDSKYADSWLKYPEQDPFSNEEGTNTTTRGYRYRSWDLGDGTKMTLRCQVDGVLAGAGARKQTLLSIKVLNAHDAKKIQSWKTTLDSMGSAALVNEFKGNANKIARWVIQGLLAGVDQFIFGFVARAKTAPTIEQLTHNILGVQTFTLSEVSKLVKVRFSSMFGVIKVIVDKLRSLDDGRYVVMRSPNKESIRVVAIPAGVDLE